MSGTQDVRQGPMTAPEMVYEFVRSRFLSIVAVLALLGIAAALIGLDLGIPRDVKLALLVGIVTSPFAYVVADWVRRLLPDPPGILLVDVDARYVEAAVYWLHVDDFQELEVTEGQLEQPASQLYFGREVDIENLTAKGTWRGTLTDRELLTALHKVDECRGQLEDDAKRGFAVRTQAFQIVRGAVRATTEHVIETFEAGTLPDEGEEIGNQIDRALERYDLDSELDEHLDDDVLDDTDGDDHDDTDGDGLGARSDDAEQDARTNGAEVTADAE